MNTLGYLTEIKADNQMKDADVLEKAKAALQTVPMPQTTTCKMVAKLGNIC